jgi:opacity protein-like surface antigen
MKMLKLLAALLLAGAGTVQAAPVTLYLDNITFTTNNTPGQQFFVGIGTTGAGYINGFCPSCGDFSVGTLTGQGGDTLSSAVVDGASVTLSNVRWIINNVFGQNYDLSFDATTTVGLGGSLSKTNIACIRYTGTGAGTTCADNTSATNPNGPIKSGYGFATDFTSLNAIGGPCVSTNVAIGNQQCAVNVIYNEAAQKLTIEISKALSETSTGRQTFTLSYVVPVPAAAWLMLSALGGLAAVRRRVAA